MSIQPQPVRYYDLPPEEEELSQAFIHYLVIKALSSSLEQQFQGTNLKVASSVNIYYPEQDAVAPDVALIEDLVFSRRAEKKRRSYYVGEGNPPPRVAFEIASEETWSRDLNQKLVRYERMKTPEYYVFDPNVPQAWGREWRKKGRLVGWWLNPFTQRLEEVKAAADGRLWSEGLESWLGMEVVEGDPYLRLYERGGLRRPTIEEAIETEHQARLAAEKREADAKKREANTKKRETAAKKRETDAKKREADTRQRLQRLEDEREAERQQIETEREAERQQIETERQRIKELEEQIRQLTRKPDESV